MYNCPSDLARARAVRHPDKPRQTQTRQAAQQNAYISLYFEINRQRTPNDGRCPVGVVLWTVRGPRRGDDNLVTILINLYQYTHTAMQKMCSGRRAGKGHASLRFAWNKKATCARARPRPTVLAQARCVERAAGKLRGRGDQLATDRVSWARSSRTTYPRWCPLHVMATYSPRRRTHPSSSLRGARRQLALPLCQLALLRLRA